MKPLSPRWKSFAGDEKGIIIVMFALMLPLLVGFVGLGVEVAFWFTLKRDLQAAADAAAVAGSYELAEGRSGSITTVATREAASNGWESCGGSCITVNNPPTNASYPTYLANTDAVEVELTRSENRLFSGWFMSDTVIVNARAVGLAVAGSSEACILALGSSNQADALKVGGNSTVTMSGCTATTNSTDDGAIDVDDGLTVDCIYSAGGINGTANTTACASPGKTNQPAVTDPYESLTKPVDSDFSNCGTNGGSISLTGAGNTATISDSDGPFCGISVNASGGTLTLNAGTYYIDQGDVSVQTGTIDATAGVTIVFGDSTGSGDCGGLLISGNSSVNITAPITEDGEPFTGLALYRSSDCDAAEDFNFSGNNTSTILGAVYNPSGDINITGTGSVGGTCLQLIADTVKFTGDSDIGSNCDDVDITTVDAGGKGSLVE